MKGVQRIWSSPYSLTPRASLGAHTSASPLKPRHGSLLKFEFSNGTVGYADLHPWTELGDEDLGTQLQKLSEQTFTQLSKRSYEVALVDAEARAKNVSVFRDLIVPDSHFLFTDLALLNETALAEIEGHGFSVFKAKAGKDLLRERVALESAFERHEKALANSQLQVRLDFNSTLNEKVATEWLTSLSPRVRARIDFCEDPTPFDAAAWAQMQAQTGVAFFCDLEAESLFGTARSNDDATKVMGVSGLVLKPARQNVALAQPSPYQLVVTSYLDHPLGQMGAAYEAARLARSRDVGLCGLCSQTAYESTPYAEALKTEGPQLRPNHDQSGFGFGDLLEAEPWHLLTNSRFGEPAT